MDLHYGRFRSRRMITVGAIFLLLPPLPSLARKWSDDTGKYSVEAELASSHDDSVQLKRQDGKLIVVPLSRLSAADRSYVAETAKTVGTAGKQASTNDQRLAWNPPERKKVFVGIGVSRVTSVEKDKVVVSVGSNALKNGDRLVIHNMHRYKGIVEIIETGPDQSVCKIILSLSFATVEVGDDAWCRDWVPLPCTVDAAKKVTKEHSDGANSEAKHSP